MTDRFDFSDTATRARRAYERTIADRPFIGPVHPDTVAKLDRALDALRRWDREVFLANRVDRLTYAEIAERYGISERTVRRRMARAYYEVLRFMKDHPVRRWRLWPLD